MFSRRLLYRWEPNGFSAAIGDGADEKGGFFH